MDDYSIRQFEVAATNLEAFSGNAGKASRESLVDVLKAAERVLAEKMNDAREILAYWCVDLALYAMEGSDFEDEEMLFAAKRLMYELKFNHLDEEC